MKNIKKSNRIGKMQDHNSLKGLEIELFSQYGALAVHISNLVAYYGEEAVVRMLAEKLVESKVNKKVA